MGWVCRYLGKIRKVMDTFNHEGCHRNHMWDLKNLENLRTFTHCIEGAKRRALVEDVITCFVRDVKAQEDALPCGVLMGDFNDANVILSNEHPNQVDGVIDFGDMIYRSI